MSPGAHLQAEMCLHVHPQVDFTKLQMAHLPAREQREEELRLYKAQQAQAAGAAGSSEAFDISERQPAFLKDKGEGLFRQCNFAAAAAAYSAAIEAAEPGSGLAQTCTCVHGHAWSIIAGRSFLFWRTGAALRNLTLACLSIV